MDVEDAILASDFVDCDKILGITMIPLGIEIDQKRPFKIFLIKEKI
jgi:hypothetical protein